MAERMVLIRFPARQLSPDDRDNGAPGIGDIVDGIEHDDD